MGRRVYVWGGQSMGKPLAPGIAAFGLSDASVHDLEAEMNGVVLVGLRESLPYPSHVAHTERVAAASVT